MSDFLNCLPMHARAHYIALRNIGDKVDREKYETKLRKLRSEANARGNLKSGSTYEAEWITKSEFIDTLAVGHIEDALETCNLYEVELTSTLCGCLERTAREFLAMQYNMQILNQGRGVTDIHMPNSAIQAVSDTLRNKTFSALSRIKVIIEKARVEDVKRRASVKREAVSKTTYNQHIHGDNNTVTQTGDVTVNHYTANDFEQLTVELDALRAALNAQPSTIEVDRTIGELAEAEEASQANDQTKVKSSLSRISKAGWEMIKTVAPKITSEIILYHLKLHGLA